LGLAKGALVSLEGGTVEPGTLVAVGLATRLIVASLESSFVPLAVIALPVEGLVSVSLLATGALAVSVGTPSLFFKAVDDCPAVVPTLGAVVPFGSSLTGAAGLTKGTLAGAVVD
jgi:hypothetical protein